jgi:hypothetical protein
MISKTFQSSGAHSQLTTHHSQFPLTTKLTENLEHKT